MKNKKAIIIGIILAVLLIHFGLRPFFNRRGATNTLKTVLKNWQSGNITGALEHWKDARKAPPVFTLSSFKILEKSFKKIDGVRTARFVVFLNLPKENLLPEKSNWVFTMEDTSIGWKITTFDLE